MLKNFFLKIKKVAMRSKIYFLFSGLFSFIWLIIRSGRKPERLTYPCQQVALNNSIIFLSYILGFIGIKASKKFFIKNVRLFYYSMIVTVLIIGFGASAFIYKTIFPEPIKADTHDHNPMGNGISRVIWVHRDEVSNWDTSGKPSDYWDYVNQSSVNSMMDDGIKALTGKSTVNSAWQSILPDYTSGKKIAIKVNFNNGGSYSFNSIPQTIRAVIDQLTTFGFQQEDIYVYDASKSIYGTPGKDFFFDYLKNIYPNIHIVDKNGGYGREKSTAGQATVTLCNRTHYFTNVLDTVDYLIDAPIFKKHGFPHVITFSFKNHFGSVTKIIYGSNPEDAPLHYGIDSGLITNPNSCFSYFGESLVVLNSQPVIKNKTRLIIGDAIFAHKSMNTGSPERNMDALFLSKDTVAADSVMFDFLHKIWVDEGDYHQTGDSADQLYLEHAATEADLGVHAHATGWSNGVPQYATVNGKGIDFVACNPNCPGTTTPTQYTLNITKQGDGTGTVVSSPSGISCGSDCSEAFNGGTTVTLSANPVTGSVFSGWNGGGCSGTGSCSINVTSNVNVIATFNQQIIQNTLAILKQGSGSGVVTSSPSGINCGSDCDQTYTQGTSITLSASPHSGSLFTGWTGGDCSGTGICVLSLNSDITITATFDKCPGGDVTGDCKVDQNDIQFILLHYSESSSTLPGQVDPFIDGIINCMDYAGVLKDYL